MAISREQKEAQVKELQDKFSRASMTVVSHFSGLTVKNTQKLRNQLAEQDVDYKVVKNTLIKIAIDNTDSLKDVDTALFEGPISLAFGYGDQVAPAKALVEFAKEHKEEIEIIGAFNADGEMFNTAQVEQLAELPSKEELQGQLVGTIAAPLTGFLNVLEGNTRGLVNVINGIKEQKA